MKPGREIVKQSAPGRIGVVILLAKRTDRGIIPLWVGGVKDKQA